VVFGMMMMGGENVNVSVMMMSDGVNGKFGGAPRPKPTSRLHTHRFPVYYTDDK